MDPEYKYGIIHAIIFVYLSIIFVDKNWNYFDEDKRELKNPFNNLFYLFIYLYLWFSIHLGIKFGLPTFGLMILSLIIFFIVLIYLLDEIDKIGVGPPLALISIFFGGLMYAKLPIDEFRNSSNVDKFFHAFIITITALIIYLYSYSPQPKMKGFALVTLVFFLNAIAILYGARESGIAPGKKLARVIKWSIYILIISSIVWYNTYGTVGNYTGDILFDPIRVIRDKPDILLFKWLPVGTNENTNRVSNSRRAKSSEEQERKDISQDYYN